MYLLIFYETVLFYYKPTIDTGNENQNKTTWKNGRLLASTKNILSKLRYRNFP